MHLAIEPDLDHDEGTYGFCAYCECNVRAVRVDRGFGFEHGSVRGTHHVWDDVCPTCGYDVLAPQAEDDECNEQET